MFLPCQSPQILPSLKVVPTMAIGVGWKERVSAEEGNVEAASDWGGHEMTKVKGKQNAGGIYCFLKQAGVFSCDRSGSFSGGFNL